MKKIIKVLFFEILVKNANFYKFCCQAMNLWLGPCLAVYFIFLLFQAGRAYELCAYKSCMCFHPIFRRKTAFYKVVNLECQHFKSLGWFCSRYFLFPFVFFPVSDVSSLFSLVLPLVFATMQRKKKERRKKKRGVEKNGMKCRV